MKRDVFEFFNLLMQGPLTQFLLRSQLPSLLETADHNADNCGHSKQSIGIF